MVKADLLINDSEIISLIEGGDYSKAAKNLNIQQKKTWPALETAYESLKSIKTKTIEFEDFSFVIQFNPGRILSTSASTDETSIRERKCFLCNENRPFEQKGILINNYILLVNPFPIFPEHFTIPGIDHTKQTIKNNFGDLLYLSKLLSEYYSVFYNGPQCGASAPDHIHFQAGNKTSLPLIREYGIIKNKYGEILAFNNEVEIFSVDDGLRKMICFDSNNRDSLLKSFDSFYEIYASHSNNNEPLMNIISVFDENMGWRVAIMLRSKHRPKEFYIKGDERILFSPAGSDFGGLCITPLEKDFNRFNKEILIKIFNEVTIDQELFLDLKKEIKAKLG